MPLNKETKPNISKCHKPVQRNIRLDGKGSLLGSVQETKILQCSQMVYTQTRICLRKLDT